MHMPCKDCVHSMLVQRLLHGLHHVIHFMLVRLVAVVPVRKVLYQFKVVILERSWTLLSARKGSYNASSMASIKTSTLCWCALLLLYLHTLQRVQSSSLPSISGRCACCCCM